MFIQQMFGICQYQKVKVRGLEQLNPIVGV